jgi:hypothetical protein
MGSLWAFLPRAEVGLVVDRKPIPKTYPDGQGGTITEAEWLKKSPFERAQIERICMEQMERLRKGGQA